MHIDQREAKYRPDLTPRLEAAVARMNIPYQWKDFTLTDNSCKTQTESATILREKFATKILLTEEQQLQEQLTSLRNAAVNTVKVEEKEAEKSIAFLEKELELFQKELVKDAEVVVEDVEKVLKIQDK